MDLIGGADENNRQICGQKEKLKFNFLLPLLDGILHKLLLEGLELLYKYCGLYSLFI
jgi:hypothetical protein